MFSLQTFLLLTWLNEGSDPGISRMFTLLGDKKKKKVSIKIKTEAKETKTFNTLQYWASGVESTMLATWHCNMSPGILHLF